LHATPVIAFVSVFFHFGKTRDFAFVDRRLEVISTDKAVPVKNALDAKRKESDGSKGHVSFYVKRHCFVKLLLLLVVVVLVIQSAEIKGMER